MKYLILFVISFFLSCTTVNGNIVEIPVDKVDGKSTLEMLDASMQTYRYFNGDKIVPPKGWLFKGDMFYGDDFFGKSEKKEFYGIVLIRESNPEELMFAFRGTVTVEEWWDDAHVKPVNFDPHNKEVSLPAELKVEEGFYLVYVSIRNQLFKYLDDVKPAKVYITGHSLGSALSELFVFDLSLSNKEIDIVSTNFACPRLGNKYFVDYYNNVVFTNTLRVVNLEDIVPKIPLTWEGYKHIPSQLSIKFKEASESVPNYGVRHSADNYYRTLQNAFNLEDFKCAFVNKKMDDIVILSN